MASANLSLDDIIRKKRMPVKQRNRNNFRGGNIGSQFNQINTKADKNDRRGFNVNVRKTGAINKIDARNKIISKKRFKITDARDKLAEIAKQGDAREKLDKLKMKKGLLGAQLMHLTTESGLRRGFSDMSRQVHPSPLMPQHPIPHRMDGPHITPYYMDVDTEEDEYVPPPMKIVRSVNNNLSRYLPPPPDFPTPLSSKRPLRDKKVVNNRQGGFNLTVVAKNSDGSRNTSGVVHTSKRSRSRPERARSPPIHFRERSPQPVSILKKRPSTTPPPTPSSSGYRILVSNLRSSVTPSDIHELFGDVGELLDSRLVRPGTAEVIYSRLEDAQKAVDVYHNRQLDKQAMNCFLVNPRIPESTSSKASASSKSRLGSTIPASSNSSVIPDVLTFYKVLFGKE